MATVVYFVTRKEEVPEKDDEYLIKGIVSELIENEESQIYKLLDKSDKTVKDFLEKTGEIKSSISGVDQQTRNLISVLNNNQSRGQWAEFQVEDLLGIMEYKDGIHYESQKIMNSGIKTIHYLTLIFTLLGILFIFIFKKVALYDEIRHIMFLIPLIFLIALYNIFLFNKKVYYILSTFVIIFFVFENVSLKKYQYTWLNSFAKFTNIKNNFEIDYLGISNKNIQKKIFII